MLHCKSIKKKKIIDINFYIDFIHKVESVETNTQKLCAMNITLSPDWLTMDVLKNDLAKV